jgi:ATP-dependent RNA helicase DDX54/DBP10
MFLRKDTFDIGKKTKSFRDEEFYLSHYQRDAHTEKGSGISLRSHVYITDLMLFALSSYSLNDGASSFAVQASRATFDLTTDEGASKNRRSGVSQLKWDRKKKKFIRGDGVGADNVKLVKTETGNKLPITYRSGRFDEWKAKNKEGIPRVGETEGPRAKGTAFGGKKWKHNKIQSSKPLDKLSIGYERKVNLSKKKNAPPGGEEDAQKKQAPVLKRGRSKGKTVGKVKNELKTADQIRKQRQLIEQRKAKNARRSRKGKGR